MRKPREEMKVFAERRARLAEKIAGSALIISSPLEAVRNGSVHYSFRQDSNMYYLTGFEEPGSIFVFRPGMKPETVMFVRKKDTDRETWDGFRFGPHETEKQFQIEKAYVVDDFAKEIVGLLKGCEKLYYRFYKNHEMDEMIEHAQLDLRTSLGRTGYGILPIYDSDELLGEMRVIKTENDLKILRQACEITANAHIEVMKYIRPGMTERELHGYFIYQIMKHGASREGYGGIFATGKNACTLHYVFNDHTIKDGELFLVDAAGEYHYFTSDITRAYPSNGKFTDVQAEVYEGILRIQKQIIEMVKPGVPFRDLHDAGADLLTDLMLELGFLTGRKEDIVKANQHRKYYPHGIGHYLGMDVHDAGLYFSKKGEPRKIEPGMVFTVEPGLYIPANDHDASEKYRGIGIRIEDNILVTQHGYENLTQKCPKEISDLERIIGTHRM